MAQVLATTKLDSEQKELVDAMVFSGDVLMAIISDILDLSKVESGTVHSSPQGHGVLLHGKPHFQRH